VIFPSSYVDRIRPILSVLIVLFIAYSIYNTAEIVMKKDEDKDALHNKAKILILMNHMILLSV